MPSLVQRWYKEGQGSGYQDFDITAWYDGWHIHMDGTAVGMLGRDSSRCSWMICWLTTQSAWMSEYSDGTTVGDADGTAAGLFGWHWRTWMMAVCVLGRDSSRRARMANRLATRMARRSAHSDGATVGVLGWSVGRQLGWHGSWRDQATQMAWQSACSIGQSVGNTVGASVDQWVG